MAVPLEQFGIDRLPALHEPESLVVRQGDHGGPQLWSFLGLRGIGLRGIGWCVVALAEPSQVKGEVW